MCDESSRDKREIWTIGHADHSLKAFIGLLTNQNIQILIDTRSPIYAQSAFPFRPDDLKIGLKDAAIQYDVFDQNICLKAEDLHEPMAFYKHAEVHPCLQFGLLPFQGWDKLEQGVAHKRIALLCSEENPTRCNRRLLISNPLATRGIKVYHIRGDGRLQTEEDLRREEDTQSYHREPTVANVTEIFTIGVTSYTAMRFFGALRRFGIRRLLDVRLNNWTQLAGFTKRDDLPFFLNELCGAEYVHEPLLAPTRTLLDAYKKNGGSWQEYEKNFLALLAERKIEDQLHRRFFDTPTVLLCYEAEADFCHRRLVLEYLQQKWGNLKVTHL